MPPRILPGPRVMKVQVEHSIDLPCVAQGVPQPSVSWKKHNTTLVPDGTQYSLSPDGTLTVLQVALMDEGVYGCVASNVAGQDEASIQLQVQGEVPSETTGKRDAWITTDYMTLVDIGNNNESSIGTGGVQVKHDCAE